MWTPLSTLGLLGSQLGLPFSSTTQQQKVPLEATWNRSTCESRENDPSSEQLLSASLPCLSITVKQLKSSSVRGILHLQGITYQLLKVVLLETFSLSLSFWVPHLQERRKQYQ